jgi:hypothetical protein
MDSPRPPQGGEGGRRPGEGGANHPARSAADFLAVENGQAFRPLPPPFYPAALRVGWLEALSRPSGALSPAKRGREGIHRTGEAIGRIHHRENPSSPRHRESLPRLVIARSAATWQSSSFCPERSDADFFGGGECPSQRRRFADMTLPQSQPAALPSPNHSCLPSPPPLVGEGAPSGAGEGFLPCGAKRR